eukprot:7917123-Alexandrium_andersonii.AAC.1
MEIIMNVLMALTSRGIDLRRKSLHLQLDNTGRENKNNAIFWALGWLVSKGILKSANASFLRTGHTHEDIDQ